MQLEIARRVGFIDGQQHEKLQQSVEQVGRMPHGLIAAVEREAMTAAGE